MMKKQKLGKIFRIVSILTVMIILFVQSPAMASEIDNTDITMTDRYNVSHASAEETEIRYMIDSHGRYWYRVWSLTRGIWLTDWILLG